MSVVRQKLTDYQEVGHALADLCAGLCDHEHDCLQCSAIAADSVPAPYDRLLVHNNHMTTTLREFHGEPIAVHVLEEEVDGDLYRRRIVLTLDGTDQIVEFGVVRIDLSFTTDEVRRAILERQTPLGDILIANRVLRRIEPRWYLRVSSQCPLQQELRSVVNGDAYGRVGTIYCNEEPAIELLEIVSVGQLYSVGRA